MKKRRQLFILGVVMLVVFVAVSVITFLESNRLIEKGYLASEGNAAQNFAVLTAANLRLSDEDVARLKAYSYEELLASDENQRLSEMMSGKSLAGKVDYAYVMVHLPEDEVKYSVSEADAEEFGAPAGTKLDIMWLLDVNVDEDAVSLNTGIDLQRYSYYIDEDALIFGEAPTYLYHSSAWGDHICGYSPLYSTDGRYIGVVGVELKTGDYNGYRSTAMVALGTLLTVSTLVLAMLFVIFYLRSRRRQLDRVYTDPMTKLGNRSYYNDLFIRRMNARRRGHPLFAMMIADLDWFKRVNDTFGHDVGDEVLIELGQILLEQFGKEQVFRFGGEEFVVGLWIEDETALNEALGELFLRVSEHLFSSRELTIGLSLGCAYTDQAPLNGWLVSGMLRAADCRLYAAKESGRGRYLITKYDPAKEYTKEEAGRS